MRWPSSCSGLPRVRDSFTSAGGAKFSPRPWAAVCLLCGMLLLAGYGHIAGRVRFRQLLEISFSGSANSSSSHSGGGDDGAGRANSSSAWSRTGSAAGMAAAAAAAGGGGSIGFLGSGGGGGALAALRDLANTSDALARTPLVHGRVRKAGMTDPRAWLSNHTDDRLDGFLSWRLNRTRAGGPRPAASPDAFTCAAADHPPLPFPGCHVFINHQYRYIYIRSPKAASTSIVNALGECNNTRTRGHNASSCMALHFYWPRAGLQLQALRDTWRDYFVFGFVRNPWRRAYSLYKYIHSSGCMDDASLRDPRCRVPWPTFCADPWEASEALHDAGCIKRSKSYLYFHMAEQYGCLRTAEGGWAVDFVGRVDEPNADWAEVVQALNANRLPGVPELPVTELEQQNMRKGGERDPYGSSGSSAAAGHARLTGQQGQQCFDAVSRWYACDVERFGFAGPSRQQVQAQQQQEQQAQQQEPGVRQQQETSVQQPGVQQPGVQQPGVQQPGVQQPGVQQPSTQEVQSQQA